MTGELRAALVAAEEATIRAITRSHDERQKQLTSQMAALGVSAEQLRAAVRVCARRRWRVRVPLVLCECALGSVMCADGGPLKLARAYECGVRVSALCGAGTAPCVRPELEARVDSGRVLSALAGMTSLIVDNGEEMARQAAEAVRASVHTACL